jgi:two-component system sensor histidine kinase UhpB
MPQRSTRLFWRVFLLDASLLTIVAVLLLATPVTISTPVRLAEALVVAAGLVVILAANAVLLRHAFLPLHRLIERMQVVDLLRPGQRLPEERDDEIGMVVRSFNHMLDRLEAERTQSGRRLLEAQEAERLAIARDLHDEVGQLLTGVLLQLQAVEDGDQQSLGTAQDAARRALDEVRRISRELRPQMLEQLGLLSALRELATSFERVAGIRVRREFADTLPALDASSELAIYRIVQESLTNVSRHARAQTVTLSIESELGHVVVTVLDDGIGIEPMETDTAGLRSMRERAVLIGAALSVAPGLAGGTQVRLEIPLEDDPKGSPR